MFGRQAGDRHLGLEQSSSSASSGSAAFDITAGVLAGLNTSTHYLAY